MSGEELREKAERIARQEQSEEGQVIKVIGSWLWIDFSGKPCLETRDMLRAEGFRWNHKRGCWQYAGVPSHKSPAGRMSLEEKYGVEEVLA